MAVVDKDLATWGIRGRCGHMEGGMAAYCMDGRNRERWRWERGPRMFGYNSVSLVASVCPHTLARIGQIPVNPTFYLRGHSIPRFFRGVWRWENTWVGPLELYKNEIARLKREHATVVIISITNSIATTLNKHMRKQTS